MQTKNTHTGSLLSDYQLDATAHPNDVLEVKLLKQEINRLRDQQTMKLDKKRTNGARDESTLLLAFESIKKRLCSVQSLELTEALEGFEERLNAFVLIATDADDSRRVSNFNLGSFSRVSDATIVETSDESTTKITKFATPIPIKSKGIDSLKSSTQMLSVSNPFSPAKTSFID